MLFDIILFCSQNVCIRMQIDTNISTSLNHCTSPNHSSIFFFFPPPHCLGNPNTSRAWPEAELSHLTPETQNCQPSCSQAHSLIICLEGKVTPLENGRPLPHPLLQPRSKCKHTHTPTTQYPAAGHGDRARVQLKQKQLCAAEKY